MSDQTQNLSQEEIALRFKKANAAGFINHMIVAAGANEKQATELFAKSDVKATRLLQKRAAIRDAILSEVNSVTTGGLPSNLGRALTS